MNEIEAAVDALRRDSVVVYPTETLYGLGVDATSDLALARLIALKLRPDDKPISVLVSDRAMLEAVAARVSAIAERLIARWWPGPLTLVMPARPELSEQLTAGTGTVGVRVSSHVVATSLVARLGRPITAPSTNPAGAPPARCVDEARGYFGNAVAVYLDGGWLAGQTASTVVDVTGNQPRVLRAGAIAAQEILQAAIGEAA